MKNKILFFLSLLFLTSILNAQVESYFGGTLNVFGSSGSSPEYNLTGFFNDTSGEYPLDSVTVGDILYISEGSTCVRLRIDTINSSAGGILDADVFDVDTILVSPPSGIGALIRETPNSSLPRYIPGLSETLLGCIRTHMTGKIDQGIANAVDGNGIYSSNGTISTTRTVNIDNAGEFKFSGQSINFDLFEFGESGSYFNIDLGDLYSIAENQARTQLGMYDERFILTAIGNPADGAFISGNIGIDTQFVSIYGGLGTPTKNFLQVNVREESIAFFDKYMLPNATPSTTLNDTTIMAWRGTGSSASPVGFVPYNSGDGNGIISSLPSGSVTIDANNNALIIDSTSTTKITAVNTAQGDLVVSGNTSLPSSLSHISGVDTSQINVQASNGVTISSTQGLNIETADIFLNQNTTINSGVDDYQLDLNEVDFGVDISNAAGDRAFFDVDSHPSLLASVSSFVTNPSFDYQAELTLDVDPGFADINMYAVDQTNQNQSTIYLHPSRIQLDHFQNGNNSENILIDSFGIKFYGEVANVAWEYLFPEASPSANQIMYWPTPTTPAFRDDQWLDNKLQAGDINITAQSGADFNILRLNSVGWQFYTTSGTTDYGAMTLTPNGFYYQGSTFEGDVATVVWGEHNNNQGAKYSMQLAGHTSAGSHFFDSKVDRNLGYNYWDYAVAPSLGDTLGNHIFLGDRYDGVQKFAISKGKFINWDTMYVYFEIPLDDTTSNISLYNGSYELPNTIPTSTSGAESIITYTGDGAGSNTVAMKRMNSGLEFDTTDGSGDVVVTIPEMPDATYLVLATPQSTIFQTVTITSKNTTSFTARFFDETGAAITGTGIVLAWQVIDY